MGTIIKPNDKSYIVIGRQEEQAKYNQLWKVLSENGYDIKKLNLANPTDSDHYNPFDAVRYGQESVQEKIGMIVRSFIRYTRDPSAQEDPFWEMAEQEFLLALAKRMCTDAPEQGLTFSRMLRMTREKMIDTNGNILREDIPGRESMLDASFDALRARNPMPECMQHYDRFLSLPPKVQRSAAITAMIRLTPFSSPEIQTLTNDSTIEWGYTGKNAREKIAVFILLSQESKYCHFLAQMLLEDMQLMSCGRQFEVLMDGVTEDEIKLPEAINKSSVKFVTIG